AARLTVKAPATIVNTWATVILKPNSTKTTSSAPISPSPGRNAMRKSARLLRSCKEIYAESEALDGRLSNASLTHGVELADAILLSGQPRLRGGHLPLLDGSLQVQWRFRG